MGAASLSAFLSSIGALFFHTNFLELPNSVFLSKTKRGTAKHLLRPTDTKAAKRVFSTVLLLKPFKVHLPAVLRLSRTPVNTFTSIQVALAPDSEQGIKKKKLL